MTNPEMPNIPGMPSMADTLEFVKTLWGGMGMPGGQPGAGMAGMNIPGMVMPTLSVEEISKRIDDLKAVESWLTLNMNMLRATIQALEVQAATLNVLNAMGQSVGATMRAAGMPDPTEAGAAAPAAATHVGNGSAAGNGSGGNGAAESDHEAHAGTRPSEQDQQDAAALTAPLVNAAAWWNALQDQFQQAVSSALAPEPPGSAKGAKTAPKAAKPAAKSAAKSAAKKTASKSKTATRRAASTPRKGSTR